MDASTPAQKERDAQAIRRVTWAGLAVNLLLAAFKFVAGVWGHSQAIVADGVHSLSDLATDLAVLWGLPFWTAPADESHPYGHRRIETLITAGIAVSLGAVALALGWRALGTLARAHVEPPGGIAAAAALASVLLKEGLYRWTLAVGRRTRSSAVIANGWHHRSDAFSSVPVLVAVAVAAARPGWAFLDDVAALLVAVVILRLSWRLALPAWHELADRGATGEDLRAIQAIAERVEGVRALHELRTRRMGAGLYVDLHILVDDNMTVRRGHEISERVKRALLEAGPDIVDVMVHLEPYGEETRRRAERNASSPRP